MREHRLLNRIRLINRNPSRRVTEDPKEMIRSIQDHLQRILNTRQGSAPIAEDFGVPDFTNFMSDFPRDRAQFTTNHSKVRTAPGRRPRGVFPQGR